VELEPLQTTRGYLLEFLAMPKPNQYELQTKYSAIKRLMPTKELERVPFSIGIEVGVLSKKIALSKLH
jgi:hypothetical protein